MTTGPNPAAGRLQLLLALGDDQVDVRQRPAVKRQLGAAAIGPIEVEVQVARGREDQLAAAQAAERRDHPEKRAAAPVDVDGGIGVRAGAPDPGGLPNLPEPKNRPTST